MYKLEEIKISYRPKMAAKDRPKITSSKDAYDILRASCYSDDTIEYTEQFTVIMLNRANAVLGVKTVSTGGLTQVIVDPKVVFQAALLCNAATIILSHNHPSGNLKPSQSDLEITRKMVDLGKLLELPVLDHLILSATDYYSLADNCDM